MSQASAGRDHGTARSLAMRQPNREQLVPIADRSDWRIVEDRAILFVFRRSHYFRCSLRSRKAETGTSVILITHDLGVVAGMTDHLIVMYAGKIFEQAATKELFARPGNPYTRGLLRSVPDPTVDADTLYQIPGQPPDLARLPSGCPFAPRCERAEEICTREFPPFVELTPSHRSLCHFANEVYAESSATS